MSSDEPAPQPQLRVVRGEPTPEELAALVSVLAARAAGSPAAVEPPAPSAWASREAGLRRPLHAGPGAWRAATLAPGVRTRAAP